MYYWKQYRLVAGNEGRLVLGDWKLSCEEGVRLQTLPGSKLIIGRTACVRTGTEIGALTDAEITIGDRFFANRNCSIVSRYGITIGNDCMLATNVTIYDHDHCFTNRDQVFRDQGFNGAPIVIGNNVWLGTNVFIGKGVTIGDNVIVGAGTVVTRSIPANSVVYAKPEIIVKPLHRNQNAQNPHMQ